MALSSTRGLPFSACSRRRTGSICSALREVMKAREAEVKSQREASDAKDRMLEAGAAAPRDCDTLGGRPRDGSSQPICPSPPVVAYDRAFQARLAAEIERLPARRALALAMPDFARLAD